MSVFLNILIKILQIIAETEKSKSRFSSKYRASYLNKPFYKPTVPTITSSTVSNITFTELQTHSISKMCNFPKFLSSPFLLGKLYKAPL